MCVLSLQLWLNIQTLCSPIYDSCLQYVDTPHPTLLTVIVLHVYKCVAAFPGVFVGKKENHFSTKMPWTRLNEGVNVESLWLSCSHHQALKTCPELLLRISGISRNLFDIGMCSTYC